MYQGWIISIGLLLLVREPPQQRFTERFDYPDGALPAAYWAEGGRASIRNGRLWLNADTGRQRAVSVWLNRPLTGDLSIELDVYLRSSADDAYNINLFFMYSDPAAKPLQQSATLRQAGLYRDYQALNGYIFTNVTNGDPDKVRYRFRRNPGFQLRTESFRPRQGRPGKRHIRLIKKGGRFQYWENGSKCWEARDLQPYNKGLLGFRTWHSSLEIDNLMIKKI